MTFELFFLVSLTHLDLSGNNVTDLGVAAVARSLHPGGMFL
jgi:hypothetical protein